METPMVIQGRSLGTDELRLIRGLIAEHPGWNRTRLSKHLCELWDWRNAKGRLKDMACRTLLLKLHRAGHVVLPPPRKSANNDRRRASLRHVPQRTEPIESTLRQRLPVRVEVAQAGPTRALFESLLAQYHYLGYRGIVGENMKYLVSDRQGAALGCVLFGAAAWKVAARDAFIGWTPAARRRGLEGITNNMRFLILPWVRVPYLASHVLSRVARRVSRDWVEKYGHPIHLLETFVERDRFRGVCYQAANWIQVGSTTGRTRNDRDRSIHAAVKDVYLYPLTKRFREALCRDA
jgi:hypothetical protein